jgi:hypothetical protein
MNRIFLGMAVACGSLMAATYVLGLCASAEARAASHVWHDVHFLVGLLTVLAGVLVHSIVFTYFLGTGKWVREVARVYRLPDWVHAQALKNKRRAFPFELVGMSLFGFTAWFGAGTDARGWPSLWHLALAATTFAFNLGAFVVEYVAIAGQARLLLEVKREADRLRAAQRAAAPAAAGTEDA